MEDAGHRRIRVLIVDEQPMFAKSLEAILSYDERVEVVGRAADGREAVEYTASLDPDVVLMDISMPVMDGFEATRQIRATGSATSILVLTGSDSRADAVRARQAGADGFVVKGRITSDLIEAIVAAAQRRDDGDAEAEPAS
jgi:DNA-binding NarL/FixJ family response regulator